MTRYVQLLIVALAIALGSCNAVTHHEVKLDAQQRWGQVRGRIKYQLAQKQFQSAQFEEAVQTASESVALDPTRADAFALLVKGNLELAKPGSAQLALDAARKAGLESADLVYLQGVIYEQRGELQDAMLAFAQAYELEPANVDFVVAQAEALVALDRSQAALDLLDANVGRLDDDGTLAALAAHIAALLGDSQEAMKRYKLAILGQRDSPLLAEELGRRLARSGRCDEALVLLTPLIDSYSETCDGGAVRRAVATCRLALGDPASAKAVLALYASTNPQDCAAQLLLAKAAVATGDVVTALRAVDLVGRREPDYPELWLVRATVRWKRGQLSKAAADLYDVLTNNPDDVEAHCLLAEVLRARGNSDTARLQFEKALEIDPECAWAAEGLKALRRAQAPATKEPAPKLTSADAGSADRR